jgi:hypothetical protein
MRVLRDLRDLTTLRGEIGGAEAGKRKIVGDFSFLIAIVMVYLLKCSNFANQALLCLQQATSQLLTSPIGPAGPARR